jgi:hypothetical protein
MSNGPSPKLFISYSWTTLEHERLVLELAKQLRDDEIDVILDKWDLREGCDAYAFMERMVTDPGVKKVAIICDLAYVEKANNRENGVGAETQIITGELYSQANQNKFVAVIVEKDADGKTVVPAYYNGRIYIDLAEDERYDQEYERLVRWVYDRPLHIKPPLGKVPAFILDEPEESLGNKFVMKRAISHLKEGKPTASAAISDYLSGVATDFEKLRITKSADIEFDDQVIQSIEKFLSTRDEILSFIHTVSRYDPTEANFRAIHRFFEQIIRYYAPPSGFYSYVEWEFDNFVFIVHELFLHTIAIFIDNEQFQQAQNFISTSFYVDKNYIFNNEQIISFNYINSHMCSLDHRKIRLGMNRDSIRADLIRERCKTGINKFESVAQADVIFFMLSNKSGGHWYPYTALHLGRGLSALPVFARATSTKFFDRLRILLNVATPSDFRKFVAGLSTNKELPRTAFGPLPLGTLVNEEKLATTP